jgi:ABC-type sugar transport system permease subunit
MLDSLLANTAAESLTLSSTLLILLSSLALGLGISLVYRQTHKNEVYSASFTIALIMLPAIIAMIILLVGNNVARAFSLAGAFSLIRFRSAPGDSKDIAYVFFSLGVGLACGMGYIGYAALFAVILCAVMMILTLVQFGQKRVSPMRLKIVVPEDLDYHGVFEEILTEYTHTFKLSKIKTTEFGSLFELTYEVMLKDLKDSKPFIDKLRCQNGNLNVVLSLPELNEQPLF